MFSRLRRFFLTGLVVLLPAALTVYTLVLIFRFADGLLGRFISPRLPFPIPGLGLLVTVAIVLIAGALAANILGRRLIALAEGLILKTPVARGIYTTVKSMVNAFASQDQAAFKKVALVEYPRRGIYCLGFVTGDGGDQIADDAGSPMVAVLVPTTPNPTSGFVVYLPRDQVRFLDISVEEGIKAVISAGVVRPSGR